MDLQVDHHVHYVRAPTRTASLPAVDLPEHEPALLDRLGGQLRERTALVATASAGAGLGVALLAGRRGANALGVLAAAGRGAALGAVVGVGTGMALDALRGEPRPGRAPAVSSAAAPAATGERLRVMSFNIHGAAGPPGSHLGGAIELERVARTIERERPDVVLLQEVDRFALQSSFADVLGSLADRLDADGGVLTGSVRNATGRESGTAVLTFNGVEVADARGLRSPDPRGDGLLRRAAGAVDTFAGWITEAATGTERSPLGMPEYRPRTTSDVLVTTPAGAAVRVLSGHFSWPADGIDHPRRQVDPIAGLLDGWQGPTIIGADFNVRSGTPHGDREAAVLGQAGLVDAFTAAGLPATAPERGSFGTGPGGPPIDRVYGSRQLAVERARVMPFAPDEPAASDHRPIVVDYRLGAG